MDDHDFKLRHPRLLLVGAIATAAILFWVSNLTEGPEHNAPYDVPAINYAAWWGFLIAAAAAMFLAYANLQHLGERFETRRKNRSARR